MACSCTTKPSDSVDGTDAFMGNGGNTTGGSGPGGQGGHGAGGAAGGNSETSQDATSGMGSGGQAGSAGNTNPGAGGLGSGGTSTADAARDTATADLPANPDAQAKSDGAPVFWTTQFVANCTPPPIAGRSQSDGHHHANEDCMQSGCHAGGSPDAGPAFLFGGTVRREGSLAPYPSVEVAVKTQSAFYSSCSAANGNFWTVATGAGSLDWKTATAGVRSANGEVAMSPIPEAGCASCHSAATAGPITAP